MGCDELNKMFGRDVYIHKLELPSGGHYTIGMWCEFQAHKNTRGQPQAKNCKWQPL